MGKSRTIIGLSMRNSLLAWGRLFILVLLLTSALVARSASQLVEEGLCREAAQGVSGGGLPEGYTVMALSPGVSYSPPMLNSYMRALLGGMGWTDTRTLAGYTERFYGPGGELWVVHPFTGVVQNRTSQWTVLDSAPLRMWYDGLEGTLPAAFDQVAVPAHLAAAAGWAIGDTLSLPRVPDGRLTEFTITAIYQPRGTGPFYDCLLSWLSEDAPQGLNFIVAKVDSAQVGLIRSWGGDPQSGSASTIVYEAVNPEQRMRDLAKAVYGSQSQATNLASGLVGVAVLVILLVAMVERRREAAIYKMVGMNSVATLSVLAFELLLAVVLALGAAAPIYWYAAKRYILDVHHAGLEVILPPFVSTAVLVVLIVAAGAFYPFALASVGTPNQLMTGQKIFLFRRKQTLRG